MTTTARARPARPPTATRSRSPTIPSRPPTPAASNDINNTLDFGFLANLAPVIHNLGGDIATYTEGGPAVLLDDSSAPEVAATVTDDQTHLNGGSLTISIMPAKWPRRTCSASAPPPASPLVDGTNVSYDRSRSARRGDRHGHRQRHRQPDRDRSTPTTPRRRRSARCCSGSTYTNINAHDPNPTTRTVSVTVNDGAAGSDSENVTVNVDRGQRRADPGRDRPQPDLRRRRRRRRPVQRGARPRRSRPARPSPR